MYNKVVELLFHSTIYKIKWITTKTETDPSNMWSDLSDFYRCKPYKFVCASSNDMVNQVFKIYCLFNTKIIPSVSYQTGPKLEKGLYLKHSKQTLGQGSYDMLSGYDVVCSLLFGCCTTQPVLVGIYFCDLSWSL